LALKNLTTPRQFTGMLASVPEASRITLLRAVNPALAAELDHMTAAPAQALVRIRKLDVDTACQLVGFVSDQALLSALHHDGRDTVAYEVRSRAGDLGVTLTAVQVFDQTAPDVNARTAKQLAKPLADVPQALSRMATIDAAEVIGFAEQVTAPATWWLELLEHTSRHALLCRKLTALAFERKAAPAAAIVGVSAQTAAMAIVEHTGVLNTSHLEALVILDKRLSISNLNATGLTQGASLVTGILPVRLKMLLGIASDDEIRELLAIHEGRVAKNQDRESVLAYQLVALATRTPAAAAVVVESLAKFEVALNGTFRGITPSLAIELLGIDGLDRETRRLLWLLTGTRLWEALNASPSGWISADDEDWVITALASEILSVEHLIEGSFRNEPPLEHARFLDRLLAEVPGTGRELIERASRWKDWGAARALEVVSGRLGENVAAWGVFSQAIHDWPGLLDDLIVAALAATE
jgi:hypothetical protein